MKALIGYLLCFGVLVTGQSLMAQIPDVIIDVEGQILVQNEEAREALAGVEIFVENKAFKTDQEGKFNCKIPYSSDNLELDISPGEYRILKPLEGKLNLSPQITVLKLKMLVVSEGASPDLIKKAEELEQRLLQSEKEHNLTKQQLARMNEVLIDTLAHFDQQRKEYLSSIEQLTKENEEFAEQIKEYEEKLAYLENQVGELTEKLYVAMEDKFLRQQDYFNKISADVKEYLLRAKDVHDLLPRVRDYYTMNYNPKQEEPYRQTIKEYEKIFLQVNNHSQEYLEAIDHYWEMPQVSDKMEQLFETKINQIHSAGIKPALDRVNKSLTPTYNPKKAGKIGENEAISLYPQLRDLENEINESLVLLRDAF